jgi:hypothetical protein
MGAFGPGAPLAFDGSVGSDLTGPAYMGNPPSEM